MLDMRLMFAPRGKRTGGDRSQALADWWQPSGDRRQETGNRRQEVGDRNIQAWPFALHLSSSWHYYWLGYLMPTIAGLLLTGCGRPPEKVIDIQLFQQWQLQPGDLIAGRRLLGGLGDLSIELKGKPIYAPFNGKVQPTTKGGCVVFSSPEVPAYWFRLCGLDHPKTGALQKGEEIGSGDSLQFAALRKQPNGKWAIVEPSQAILERTLKQS